MTLPWSAARRMGLSVGKPRRKGTRCVVSTSTVQVTRGRHRFVRALDDDEFVSLLVFAVMGVWP